MGSDDVNLDEEFAKNARNARVGTTLVSESQRVRVWHIHLKPGERLPVHYHQADYFWTALDDGFGRTHLPDGGSRDVTYRAGDTKHNTFARGEGITHSLENIGETDLRFTTVEFKDGENPVLPLEGPD